MKREPPRPCLTLRVFPEHKSLYARVRVYATITAMRKAMRAELWPVNGDRFKASVCSLQRGKGARKYPHFAEMFLCAKSLGTEVITHESYHVLVAFARRRKFELDDGEQMGERGALALGRIARQIVDALYAAKLLPSPRARSISWSRGGRDLNA